MKRLTWRDGVATVLAAVILASYAAYTPGPAATRVLGAAVLLAGIGMCIVGAAPAMARPAGATVYVAGALGLVTLVAAVVAVAAASQVALALQVGATLTLWLFTTVRHAATRSGGGPVEPPRAEVLLELHKDALPPRVDIR
ncbi:hypothetical protein [Dactylosporangium sp. CA-233914]|uniref:hypothetical protein n=1 Tax=Dactylosporangium sp. CA-233914 TaxID=3239934 RepID=UPI003D8FF7EF